MQANSVLPFLFPYTMSLWTFPAATFDLLMQHPEIWQWARWRQKIGATGNPWDEGSVPIEWSTQPDILAQARIFVMQYRAIDPEDELGRQDFIVTRKKDWVSKG